MAFKFPKVEVTRVNLKPLVPIRDLERINPAKVLKSLQREVLQQIRHELLQGAFSNRAKKALYNGVEIKVGPSSITVIAKHPAFRPLLEGQKPGQMTWLTKAKGPIPIVTEEGEVIFRSATPRSMENGSWYHPGRQPTLVLERAREAAREIIKKRVKSNIQRQVRAIATKAGRR